MRCVTRKPPKMFTLARTSARKPKARAEPGAGDGQRHADRKQRADHDHRGDRVRDRHQRRVQRRRHRPDDVVADEDREHEDREAEHGRVDGAAGRAVRCRAERRGGLIDIDLRRRRPPRGQGGPPPAPAPAPVRKRSPWLDSPRSSGFRLEGGVDDGAVAGQAGRARRARRPTSPRAPSSPCRPGSRRRRRGCGRRAPRTRRRAGPAR